MLLRAAPVGGKTRGVLRCRERGIGEHGMLELGRMLLKLFGKVEGGYGLGGAGRVLDGFWGSFWKQFSLGGRLSGSRGAFRSFPEFSLRPKVGKVEEC